MGMGNVAEESSSGGAEQSRAAVYYKKFEKHLKPLKPSTRLCTESIRCDKFAGMSLDPTPSCDR